MSAAALLTDEAIAAIKARWRASTEGEWTARSAPFDYPLTALMRGRRDATFFGTHPDNNPDVEFCAAAHADIPTLLDDARKAREEIAVLKAQVAELESFQGNYHHATTIERADHAEEVAAMEADKRRLDWLEKIGFATIRTGRAEGTKDDPGVFSWRKESGVWGWTAAWIGSEFRDARAAIDAAMGPQ